MVDGFCVCGEGTHCEWLKSIQSCDVNINLSAEFTERQNKILSVMDCKLGAYFSSAGSGNVQYILNRVIMRVCFENSVIKLPKNASESGVHVINWLSDFNLCA